MASQIDTPAMVIGDHLAVPLKKILEGRVAESAEPVLDEEGNVIPPRIVKPLYQHFGQTSPIARLAAAADLKKPIPTAGQYAIERCTEPQMEIPPECYLYDEERPWVLGKLNKEALDLPEPAEPVSLSQSVLDRLNALEISAIKATRARAQENTDEAEVPVVKKVTIVADEKNEAVSSVTSVEDKIDAALTHAPKPKPRNASPAPAKGTPRPVSKGKPSISPAPKSGVAAAGRPKTPKSPGRGVSPQTKILSSGAPKKVMNAK